MNKTLTRRTAFAGAAALSGAAAFAVAPAVAAPQAPTLIGTLWAQAEALNGQLVAHRTAIAEATANGGISGWMRLGGEANRIASERYDRLVAILNARPTSTADLAIMARVAQDEEFRNGARGFAAEKLAEATLGMFAAAA